VPGVAAVADDLGRRSDHVSGHRPRAVIDDGTASSGVDPEAG
jgi:hypothetical protein